MRAWLRLLVSVGLLCVVLQGRMHWTIFYMMLLTLIVSVYLPRHIVANLALTRTLDSNRLFVGESTDLRMTVANGSRLPVSWLHVRQNLPFSLSDSSASYSLSLAPLKSQTVTVPLTATERGFHRLGRIVWTVGDPLGLADIGGEADMSDWLLVYPKLYRLEGWPLQSKVHLGDTRAADVWFEDPARVIGMRDYSPGDAMKRINWKVSARSGCLKVREFEPTVTATYHILLNLDDADYRYETTSFSDPELSIEFAGSLAYRLSTDKAQVGLATNGRDAAAHLDTQMGNESIFTESGVTVCESSRGNIVALLEVLARVRASSECSPFLEMSARRLATMPRGATILIITPRPGEALNRIARESVTQGHRTAVFLVGRPKQEQLDELFPDKVPFYWVDRLGRAESLAIRSVTELVAPPSPAGGRLA